MAKDELARGDKGRRSSDSGIARIGFLSAEWLLVGLMVASALLSALAVWESTRFAGQSGELTLQARFAEATNEQWFSSVQTKIAHDQRLVLGCNAAIRQRDRHLSAYVQTFNNDDRQQLVQAEQTRIGLESQLLAGFCLDYDTAGAIEREELVRQDQNGVTTAAQLDSQARAYDALQALALGATVVFALCLLTLTLADSTDRRLWFSVWVVASLALLAIGLVLISIAEIRSWLAAPLMAVLVVGSMTGFGGLVWLIARADRRRRSGHTAKDVRIRWWAEVLGGLAIVLLALAVIGSTNASMREGETLSRAQSLTSDSRRALEIGQQSALSVLAFIQELTEIDAATASGIGEPTQDADGSEAQAALRADLLDDVWGQELETWEVLLDQHQSTSGGSASSGGALETSSLGCLSRELVLPWYSETVVSGYPGGPETLPQRLIAASGQDPNAFWRLIVSSTTGSSICSTQAAVLRDSAAHYSDQSSIFTVAVVVLGLAGFIFALAADGDRSLNPSRWLFMAAAIGMVVGIATLFYAWRFDPGLIDTDEIVEGSIAFARAETAATLADCDDAAAYSEDSLTSLPGFAPARVAYALSSVCDDSNDSLLFKTQQSDEGLEGFVASLEEALDLGSESASARINLGWGYILRSLDVDMTESEAALEKAEDMTISGLDLDPSNPFACFNWALIALLRDDIDGAAARYQHALDNLDGLDGSDGPCEPTRFEDPDLRSLMRVLALADLELVEDREGAVDRIRSLIVGGVELEVNSDVSQDRFVLVPDQVGLSLTDTGGNDDATELSVVWYYRPKGGDIWSVLKSPTLGTIEPGTGYLGRWAPLGLLPDGDYRADVYTKGLLTDRVTATGDLWGSYAVEPSTLAVTTIRELGLQVALPGDWSVISRIPGTEVVYGGEDGHVAFRRAEGSAYDDLAASLNRWTASVLSSWGDEPLTEDETGLNGEGWFLGMSHTWTAAARDGLLRGAGHTQYVTVEDGGVLSREDIERPTCPGSSVLTVIDADDPDLAETIWLSLAFVKSPFAVDISEIGFSGSFATGDYAVAIPDDWVAVGCPGHFVASEQANEANFRISSEVWTNDLDAYVTSNLSAIADQFEGFSLVSQDTVELANGVEAEQVHFVWKSDDLDIDQTQVYVVSLGQGYVLTFTTTVPAAGRYQGDLEEVITSFQVGTPLPPVIEARCSLCTPSELVDRQEDLDQLSDLIHVIGDDCQDTTDSGDKDSLATIECELPGGFDVSYVLWPNRRQMNALTLRLQDKKQAKVQIWDGFGDFDDPDGTTIEWLADGVARFFWTYDDLLVTGDASLASGDQERLNDWWRTAGALLRE